MVMTDPIADYLTRIRIAKMAKHTSVEIPASSMKKSLSEILKNEGFIRDYQVEDDNKQYMKDYTQGRFTTYKVVESFDNVELQNVSKLLCITYNEDEIISLQKELSKQFEGKLAIVRSHKYYLEFTDINATKGNAMNFLKKLWNINTDEVFASGDQDNDYDLLKNAGVKIAMGNASEKLKSIADYVCPTINEDGLADAIEKYILKGALK